MENNIEKLQEDFKSKYPMVYKAIIDSYDNSINKSLNWGLGMYEQFQKMLQETQNEELDWNFLIREYHKVSTYVWNNNIQTKEFSELENAFELTVSRNAPKEANEILTKLKEFMK